MLYARGNNTQQRTQRRKRSLTLKLNSLCITMLRSFDFPSLSKRALTCLRDSTLWPMKKSLQVFGIHHLKFNLHSFQSRFLKQFLLSSCITVKAYIARLYQESPKPPHINNTVVSLQGYSILEQPRCSTWRRFVFSRWIWITQIHSST